MDMHSCKVTKFFNASAEKLFSAWSGPEQMVHWMGPGEVICEKVEMDFRVGGDYQIFMLTNDGPMTAYGTYRDIQENRLISFTWGWRQNDLEETLVTISLRDVSEGTELTLEHTGFPQQDTADHHNMGWTAICEKLDQFLDQ